MPVGAFCFEFIESQNSKKQKFVYMKSLLETFSFKIFALRIQIYVMMIKMCRNCRIRCRRCSARARKDSALQKAGETRIKSTANKKF